MFTFVVLALQEYIGLLTVNLKSLKSFLKFCFVCGKAELQKEKERQEERREILRSLAYSPNDSWGWAGWQLGTRRLLMSEGLP